MEMNDQENSEGDMEWPSDDENDKWSSDEETEKVIKENESGNDKSIDWRILVENKYYNAEMIRRDDAQAALNEFLQCISMEEEKTRLIGSNEMIKRFDSLTYCVLLQFELGYHQEMVKSFEKLLILCGESSEYITPNDLNKAIHKILDFMEKEVRSSSVGIESDLENKENSNEKLNQFENEIYNMILDYFSRNEARKRTWFTFGMRLCKRYLKRNEIIECNKILNELHLSCQTKDGNDDNRQGGNLLQIYAIKIQIMTLEKNSIALNELFDKTSKLVSDVNDDSSISVIYECWAKMYASMNDWDKSCKYFFDSFGAYSRIGNLQAKECLKYLIISSMILSNENNKNGIISSTNPFGSAEASAYRTDSQILLMSNLLDSFENNEIKQFTQFYSNVMVNNKDDLFINQYMPFVKNCFRSRVLIELIKAYERVKLEWLAKQLNTGIEDIETLVINLIKDGSINGKLDQINLLFENNKKINMHNHGSNNNNNNNNGDESLCEAMDGWMKAVKRLQHEIGNKSQKIENGARGNFKQSRFDSAMFSGFGGFSLDFGFMNDGADDDDDDNGYGPW